MSRVFVSTVLSQDDDEEEVSKVQTLCDKPIINAADRLVINTVRVYREDYYWNLNGLPTESGH